MSRHNQLLSGVQVKNLVFTSGNSSSVQVNSANGLFGGVTFLVNFALAASSAIKVQESADGSTWTLRSATRYQPHSAYRSLLSLLSLVLQSLHLPRHQRPTSFWQSASTTQARTLLSKCQTQQPMSASLICELLPLLEQRHTGLPCCITPI